MGQFFKYVLATIVGVVISSAILVFIIIGVVASMVSSVTPGGGTKEVVVPSNAILHITLDHQIVEKAQPSPLDDLNIPGSGVSRGIGLNDIVQRINYAKTDDNIKGIYLNISSVDAGFASLRAIRQALEDFKSSGKFIVSYNNVMTQKAYYVSSVADEIYLNPVGSVEFVGLASSVMFFKDALDKVGVDMQVIKVGTYKSAVEPFILDAMSSENREQVTSYLNDIYHSFVMDISASRQIDSAEVRRIANDYLIQKAQDAVDYKLVDSVLYKDELFAKLKEKLAVAADKDLATVSILDYKKSALGAPTGNSRIAVLYAHGEIVDGEGAAGQIGGESFSRELRALRENDKVKAVVLRVNSPGGSAMASDIIWREVELTKQVKPVIVSMGDYAASGGYYISAAADSIFADASTLTGSIGVFGMIPNIQRLLNDKLGVKVESVKTGQYADMGIDLDRPLTEEEKSIVQLGVNRIYQEFMQRVADGRGMTIGQVDSIGQGRVWTGNQAVGLGLVDRVASLDDAIKAAASKANIEDYKVVEYPRTKDGLAAMFEVSKEEIKMWFWEDELGEQVKYIKEIKNILNRTGIQARMPYTVEIH